MSEKTYEQGLRDARVQGYNDVMRIRSYFWKKGNFEIVNVLEVVASNILNPDGDEDQDQ